MKLLMVLHMFSVFEVQTKWKKPTQAQAARMLMTGFHNFYEDWQMCERMVIDWS